jgi:hypothetical protein
VFDEVNDDNQQLIMALGPKKQYRERRVYRNPSEFFQRFRMPERMVEKLLQIIGPTIKPIVPSNYALSAEKRSFFILANAYKLPQTALFRATNSQTVSIHINFIIFNVNKVVYCFIPLKFSSKFY